MKKILVIDDHVDSCDLLLELLSLHGYEARAAFTGSAGLIEMERFDPDALVLDLGLPDMDGFELVRRLRTLLATRLCRIVVVSGFASKESRCAALSAGADAFFPKPVSMQRLIEELERTGSQ